MTVITPPQFASDPNTDLLRRIIEARNAYERVCNKPPSVIYLGGDVLTAMQAKGFRNGTEYAGMRIIERRGEPADDVIVSRDERLFHVPPETAVKRKAKAR